MDGWDIWTVAQTVWGEARGEPILGQYAVAHVIYNRAMRTGRSPGYECKRKWQFSCWNVSDPNRKKMEQLTLLDIAFRTCLTIAIEVLGGVYEDNTNGSRHFHAANAHPYWAVGLIPTVIIGNHMFYNDVR